MNDLGRLADYSQVQLSIVYWEIPQSHADFKFDTANKQVFLAVNEARHASSSESCENFALSPMSLHLCGICDTRKKAVGDNDSITQ